MMAEKETPLNAFQAIKNKWKQDASKFGSPLPVSKGQSQFPRRLSQSAPYVEDPSTNEEEEPPKLNSQNLKEETGNNNHELESIQKLKYVADTLSNKYSSTVEGINQTNGLRSISLRTLPTKTPPATNVEVDSPSKTSRGGENGTRINPPRRIVEGKLH
jgi:hypothetical protein